MQNPQIRKLMLWMAFGFVLLFVSASMLSASERGALDSSMPKSRTSQPTPASHMLASTKPTPPKPITQQPVTQQPILQGHFAQKPIKKKAGKPKIVAIDSAIANISANISASISQASKSREQAKIQKLLNYAAQDIHACNAGYGFSCFKTAQWMLFSDINDINAARAYYHRACALGFREGCYEFAKIQASPNDMYRAYWRLWERGES
ncbi:hypothetical protein BKN38_00520 [Helicobacter sp. CLO-3]|uniref:hypothetical protein n=1 Tax=unclassified Helicobacter TaxID=2593540 RepID=UPI0008058A14|nr:MULTISPECIES: hypothetical protein [unclassified Helicobacter]OBV28399.1 hypothetical protein BA723_02120 [Helicobacter sp. CLO-3]OHU85915.1 hypothetical protein BKN38_00520 [Helicobacter sp. CLO-3]